MLHPSTTDRQYIRGYSEQLRKVITQGGRTRKPELKVTKNTEFLTQTNQELSRKSTKSIHYTLIIPNQNPIKTPSNRHCHKSP